MLQTPPNSHKNYYAEQQETIGHLDTGESIELLPPSPQLPALLIEEERPQNERSDEVTAEGSSIKLSGRRIVDFDHLLNEMLRLGDGHESCGVKHMKITYEKRYGFTSCVTFKCTYCYVEKKVWTSKPPPSPKTPDAPANHEVNRAAVTSVMCSGITHGILSQFLGGMNMPTMAVSTFYKIHNNLEDEIYEATLQDMVAAGNEEREIAEKKNQFVTIKNQQIPWITVIVDGTWLRRSYKGNYASLMGAVSKAKLIYLFFYCIICTYIAEKIKLIFTLLFPLLLSVNLNSQIVIQ